MLRKRSRCLALVPFRRFNGIRVSFPRPVAPLAARDIVLARNARLGVSSFFILSEFWLVARPASFGAGVIGGVAFEQPGGHGGALQRLGHLLRERHAGQEAEPTG